MCTTLYTNMHKKINSRKTRGKEKKLPTLTGQEYKGHLKFLFCTRKNFAVQFKILTSLSCDKVTAAVWTKSRNSNMTSTSEEVECTADCSIFQISCRSAKDATTKSGKMVVVQVTLLDDQTISFEVDSKATGDDLLVKVADYLQVT